MNAFAHLVGFYDDGRTVLHLPPGGRRDHRCVATRRAVAEFPVLPAQGRFHPHVLPGAGQRRGGVRAVQPERFAINIARRCFSYQSTPENRPLRHAGCCQHHIRLNRPPAHAAGRTPRWTIMFAEALARPSEMVYTSHGLPNLYKNALALDVKNLQNNPHEPTAMSTFRITPPAAILGALSLFLMPAHAGLRPDHRHDGPRRLCGDLLLGEARTPKYRFRSRGQWNLLEPSHRCPAARSRHPALCLGQPMLTCTVRPHRTMPRRPITP